MLKQYQQSQQQQEEGESVKDIKSEEMVVEDHKEPSNIDRGEQQVEEQDEDDEELTEEQ